MPVIQAGYTTFLERHGDAAEILILGKTFAEDYPPMTKEIRALPAESAAHYLNRAGRHPPVRVVERHDLRGAITGDLLVLPDEEISRALVTTFELAAKTTIEYDRTFLRWERAWSLARRPVDYDGAVAVDELSRRFIRQAAEAAERSSDWWRQVGAVAVRDGAVLDVAHNEHGPSEQAPYINGDPRNEFRRGVRIDLSTAIHAEATIVARAARAGTRLEGADLYVSTFPCPGCARLVATTGFRRCYFAGPYAMLDGETVLRSAGVELIWVDLADPPAQP